MIDPAIEQLADAVLYEGYNLYPYRPSALKNRYRWLFGCVFPKCWCEAHPGSETWRMQTQCLMSGASQSTVEVTVRYLQPTQQTNGRPNDPEKHGITTTFRLDELLTRSRILPVENSPTDTRIRFGCERYSPKEPGSDCNVFRLTLRIENLTDMPNAASASRVDALPASLVSVQTILHTPDGEFISSIDPPSKFRDAVEACENIGLWPVLAGNRSHPTMMLSVPIVLEDFPSIAPESPGDLFDGAEIDELLSLRIQTLTDDEKREAAAADERTSRMLERTESLNGLRMQSLHSGRRNVGRGEAGETHFRPGDRVRLRPRRRADAFDIMLDGKTAVITAVERDFENNTHIAVTVDDDPGRDLGAAGMPGHRFFFHPDEVEPLGKVTIPKRAERTATKARILIAGIGNVFKGDDGFGVAVAEELAQIDLPDDVAVGDFGIRGVDLAFAITGGYETVILVDAMPRRGMPGRVSVIKPDLKKRPETSVTMQGHNLDPLSVLHWARDMAGTLPEVYVVGCEPAVIPDDEELLEVLSPPVRAAVAEAVEVIQELIGRVEQRSVGSKE